MKVVRNELCALNLIFTFLLQNQSLLSRLSLKEHIHNQHHKYEKHTHIIHIQSHK